MSTAPALRPSRARTALAGLALAAFSALAAAQTPPSIVELAAQRCGICHGLRGESTNEQFPQLAGQNARYIVKQLEDFRAGRRSNVAMDVVSKELDAAQIEAIAKYYEQQTPQPHPSTDALLVGVGRYVWERGNPFSRVPACASCHKDAVGRGNAHLPRLAGQHPLYVENQLKRFHVRERKNDAGPMTFVTDRLTELEMRAVAAYIGGMIPPR